MHSHCLCNQFLTFSYCESKTLYPLNSFSFSLLPIPWHPLFYFVSVSLTILDTSCKRNPYTIFSRLDEWIFKENRKFKKKKIGNSAGEINPSLDTVHNHSDSHLLLKHVSKRGRLVGHL